VSILIAFYCINLVGYQFLTLVAPVVLQALAVKCNRLLSRHLH